MRKQLSTSKSVMILAAWGALIGCAHRKHLRSEQANPNYDRSLILKARKRWMDHPLVGWIVENGLVWTGALGKLLIFGLPHPRRSRLRNFLVSVGGFMFADRFLMLTNWLVTHKLYSHIPFFNSKGPHPFTSARKQFWEFVQLIVVSHIALAALFLSKLEASKAYKLGVFRPDWSIGRDLRAFRPLSFCAKLAIARTVRSLKEAISPFWQFLAHERIQIPCALARPHANQRAHFYALSNGHVSFHATRRLFSICTGG